MRGLKHELWVGMWFFIISLVLFLLFTGCQTVKKCVESCVDATHNKSLCKELCEEN